MVSYTDPSSGAPNVPDWEEDANSPMTATNATSATINLAKEYDLVLLLSDPSNIGFNDLTVNGVTSGYEHENNAGTVTSADNKFRVARAARRGTIMLVADSQYGKIRYTADPADTAEDAVIGECTDASPPLTSITITDSGGFNRNTAVRVYGVQL